MTHQELYQNLLEANRGRLLISKHKLQKILGVGHPKAEKIVKGLTPVYNQQISRVKGTKLYFIDDVAKEIMRKGI